MSTTAIAQEHWVATWAAAPVDVKNDNVLASVTTIRNIAHLSIGGKTLRIMVSNEFGKEPLSVNGASIAVSDAAGGGQLKGDAVRITFSGKPSVVIPPGTLKYSDPVQFNAQPLDNLAISLLMPAQQLSRLTQHNASHGTNYNAPGDQLMQPTLKDASPVKPWRFLKGVSVLAPAAAGAVVCFGDSITDGTGIKDNADDRWPDDLSAWLQDRKGAAPLAVINEGIGGNRILHDGTGPAALGRFQRDVLDQDGVHSVILLESINDISHTNAAFSETYLPVTADDLIAGMKTLIQQAHAHGLKIYGGTITPYLGAKYYWPGGDQIRMAVNTFIREGKAFDGVIDFDRMLAQPDHPEALIPAYEHGDHLHPSEAGYRVMAEGVEKVIF